jgi:hypothetical protein
VEIIAAVAIGLNPYVGTFVLASLTAMASGHVPRGDAGTVVPAAIFAAVAVLAGLAAPIDFVLGKFARFAPAARRFSQLVAPVCGALAAVSLSESEVPLPIVAAGGAVISWSVAAMLTNAAARASRSAAWVGLGHIPVLMAAATAAATIIPLGLAKPGIGYGLSATAFLSLGWATLISIRRAAQAAAPARGARRAAVAPRR